MHNIFLDNELLDGYKLLKTEEFKDKNDYIYTKLEESII